MQRSELEKRTAEKVGKIESAAAPKRKQRRNQDFTFRCTPEEYEEIMSFWREERIPAASGVRALVLKHVRRHG